MCNAIDAIMPVEPESLAALFDARNRETVGRLMGRLRNPWAGRILCAEVIAE